MHSQEVVRFEVLTCPFSAGANGRLHNRSGRLDTLSGLLLMGQLEGRAAILGRWGARVC